MGSKSNVGKLGFLLPTIPQQKKLKQVGYDCSVEVSPPNSSRIPIPSAFTEQEKAFIGPHHVPKILGQRPDQPLS